MNLWSDLTLRLAGLMRFPRGWTDPQFVLSYQLATRIRGLGVDDTELRESDECPRRLQRH